MSKCRGDVNSPFPGRGDIRKAEAECVWACMKIGVDGLGGPGSLFFFSSSMPVGSDMGPWLPAFISSLKGARIPGWWLWAEAENLGSLQSTTLYLLSINRAPALRGVDCRDPQ